MKHHASAGFWKCYDQLPAEVRALADQHFTLLKENPKHPSLHFKRIKQFHAVRVGRQWRALGVDTPDGILWFWIGRHDEYDRIIA